MTGKITRIDSYRRASDKSEIHENVGKRHPVPHGVNLTTEERRWFRQWQDARLYSEWSSIDLNTLVKIAKLETQIRRGKLLLEELAAQNDDIFTEDGRAAFVQKQLTMLERSQSTLMRLTGLSKAPQRGSDDNANARAKEARGLERDAGNVRTIGLATE